MTYPFTRKILALILVTFLSVVAAVYAQSLCFLEDAFVRGQYEQAIEQAVAVIKLEPQNREALAWLQKASEHNALLQKAREYLGSQDYDRALMLLLKLKIASPQAEFLDVMIADARERKRLAFVEEFRTVCLDILREVEKLQGAGDLAGAGEQLQLLELKFRSFQYSQQMQDVQRALQTAQSRNARLQEEQVIAQIVERAERAFAGGRIDEARQVLAALLEEYPRHRQAGRLMAKVERYERTQSRRREREHRERFSLAEENVRELAAAGSSEAARQKLGELRREFPEPEYIERIGGLFELVERQEVLYRQRQAEEERLAYRRKFADRLAEVRAAVRIEEYERAGAMVKDLYREFGSDAACTAEISGLEKDVEKAREEARLRQEKKELQVWRQGFEEAVIAVKGAVSAGDFDGARQRLDALVKVYADDEPFRVRLQDMRSRLEDQKKEFDKRRREEELVIAMGHVTAKIDAGEFDAAREALDRLTAQYPQDARVAGLADTLVSRRSAYVAETERRDREERYRRRQDKVRNLLTAAEYRTALTQLREMAGEFGDDAWIAATIRQTQADYERWRREHKQALEEKLEEYRQRRRDLERRRQEEALAGVRKVFDTKTAVIRAHLEGGELDAAGTAISQLEEEYREYPQLLSETLSLTRELDARRRQEEERKKQGRLEAQSAQIRSLLDQDRCREAMVMAKSLQMLYPDEKLARALYDQAQRRLTVFEKRRERERTRLITETEREMDRLLDDHRYAQARALCDGIKGAHADDDVLAAAVEEWNARIEDSQREYLLVQQRQRRQEEFAGYVRLFSESLGTERVDAAKEALAGLRGEFGEDPALKSKIDVLAADLEKTCRRIEQRVAHESFSARVTPVAVLISQGDFEAARESLRVLRDEFDATPFRPEVNALEERIRMAESDAQRLARQQELAGRLEQLAKLLDAERTAVAQAQIKELEKEYPDEPALDPYRERIIQMQQRQRQTFNEQIRRRLEEQRRKEQERIEGLIAFYDGAVKDLLRANDVDAAQKLIDEAGAELDEKTHSVLFKTWRFALDRAREEKRRALVERKKRERREAFEKDRSFVAELISSGDLERSRQEMEALKTAWGRDGEFGRECLRLERSLQVLARRVEAEEARKEALRQREERERREREARELREREQEEIRIEAARQQEERVRQERERRLRQERLDDIREARRQEQRRQQESAEREARQKFEHMQLVRLRRIEKLLAEGRTDEARRYAWLMSVLYPEDGRFVRFARKIPAAAGTVDAVQPATGAVVQSLPDIDRVTGVLERSHRELQVVLQKIERLLDRRQYDQAQTILTALQAPAPIVQPEPAALPQPVPTTGKSSHPVPVAVPVPVPSTAGSMSSSNVPAVQSVAPASMELSTERFEGLIDELTRLISDKAFDLAHTRLDALKQDYAREDAYKQRIAELEKRLARLETRKQPVLPPVIVTPPLPASAPQVPAQEDRYEERLRHIRGLIARQAYEEAEDEALALIELRPDDPRGERYLDQVRRKAHAHREVERRRLRRKLEEVLARRRRQREREAGPVAISPASVSPAQVPVATDDDRLRLFNDAEERIHGLLKQSQFAQARDAYEVLVEEFDEVRFQERLERLAREMIGVIEGHTADVREQRLREQLKEVDEVVKQHNYPHARAILIELQRNYPDDERLLARMQKIAEAEERERMNRLRDRFRELVERALSFLDKKQFAQARSLVEDIKAEFSSEAEFLRDIESLSCRVADAEQSFEQARREQSYRERFEQARRLLRKRSFGPAIAILEDLRREYPQKIEVHRLLDRAGEALHAEGREAETETVKVPESDTRSRRLTAEDEARRVRRERREFHRLVRGLEREIREDIRGERFAHARSKIDDLAQRCQGDDICRRAAAAAEDSLAGAKAGFERRRMREELEKRLRSARELATDGRLEEALAYLEELSREYPDHSDVSAERERIAQRISRLKEQEKARMRERLEQWRRKKQAEKERQLRDEERAARDLLQEYVRTIAVAVDTDDADAASKALDEVRLKFAGDQFASDIARLTAQVDAARRRSTQAQERRMRDSFDEQVRSLDGRIADGDLLQARADFDGLKERFARYEPGLDVFKRIERDLARLETITAERARREAVDKGIADAGVFRAEGRYDEAERILEELQERFPDDARPGTLLREVAGERIQAEQVRKELLRKRLDDLRVRRREDSLLSERKLQIEQAVRSGEFDRAYTLLDELRGRLTVLDLRERLDELAAQVRIAEDGLHREKTAQRLAEFERKAADIRALLEAGRVSEARMQLDAVGAQYRNDPDTGEACRELERELRLHEERCREDQRRKRYEEGLREAELLMVNERYDEARNRLTVLRREFPREPESAAMLRDVVRREGRWKRRQAQIRAERFRVLAEQAESYIGQDKFLQAKVQVDNLKTTFAGHREFTRPISRLERLLQESTRRYERMLKTRKLADGLTKVRSLAGSKDYDSARELLESLREEYPDDPAIDREMTRIDTLQMQERISQKERLHRQLEDIRRRKAEEERLRRLQEEEALQSRLTEQHCLIRNALAAGDLTHAVRLLDQARAEVDQERFAYLLEPLTETVAAARADTSRLERERRTATFGERLDELHSVIGEGGFFRARSLADTLEREYGGEPEFARRIQDARSTIDTQERLFEEAMRDEALRRRIRELDTLIESGAYARARQLLSELEASWPHNRVLVSCRERLERRERDGDLSAQKLANLRQQERRGQEQELRRVDGYGQSIRARVADGDFDAAYAVLDDARRRERTPAAIKGVDELTAFVDDEWAKHKAARAEELRAACAQECAELERLLDNGHIFQALDRLQSLQRRYGGIDSCAAELGPLSERVRREEGYYRRNNVPRNLEEGLEEARKLIADGKLVAARDRLFELRDRYDEPLPVLQAIRDVDEKIKAAQGRIRMRMLKDVKSFDRYVLPDADPHKQFTALTVRLYAQIHNEQYAPARDTLALMSERFGDMPALRERIDELGGLLLERIELSTGTIISQRIEYALDEIRYLIAAGRKDNARALLNGLLRQFPGQPEIIEYMDRIEGAGQDDFSRRAAGVENALASNNYLQARMRLMLLVRDYGHDDTYRQRLRALEERYANETAGEAEEIRKRAGKELSS